MEMDSSTTVRLSWFFQLIRRHVPVIKTHRPEVARLLVAFLDCLVLNAAFFAAYWLRFHVNLAFTVVEMPPLSAYLKALVVVNYVCFFLFLTNGVYRRERFQTILEEFNTIFKSLTFSLLFVASLTFFVREFDYSRLLTLYAWVLASAGYAGVRFVLGRYERFLRAQEGVKLRSLVVGTGEMATLLAEKFTNRKSLGFHIIGHVATTDTSAEDDEKHILGNVKKVVTILDQNRVDAVFVADSNIDHYSLLEIVEACEQRHIRVTLVPSIYDLLISYRDVYHFDGVPVVSLEENTIDDFSVAIKRLFDIVFSLAVVMVTSPFWVAVAIAIKATSEGPVLFIQRRAGQHGKPFSMLKFRTMVKDAPEKLKELVNVDELDEPVFKLKDDPRITGIGKFLRRWSLDELPQFLNVLMGQMSVVGPRPEEVGMVARYNVWQRRRLKIKPGITGLQQITNRGIDSLSERVKYDVLYIRRYSLVLDLKIIAQTALVVWNGRGVH